MDERGRRGPRSSSNCSWQLVTPHITRLTFYAGYSSSETSLHRQISLYTFWLHEVREILRYIEQNSCKEKDAALELVVGEGDKGKMKEELGSAAQNWKLMEESDDRLK